MTASVLVPLDGSRNSLRALDHVSRVAAPGSVTVHLLNVEMPLDDYGMVPAYLHPKDHRRLTRERARGILAAGAKRLDKAGVPHAEHVVWGEVAESIARTARRLRCDTIVMGTRGMGAVGSLLLGSTATKVIHLAKVPVTLVK